MDYLEVIGKGKELAEAPAPFIAIPTTAGTGSEVTRNSVLTSTEHRVKVSLRSPMMLPDAAVVDPELTYTMPPTITASTGLDALTQVLESYVSINSNPLTDAICLDGLQRGAHALRRAFEDGNDKEARRDMALVSLYGGLALANSKLGAVHGLAGPMGAMIHAPHGVICACLLPLVMEANIDALHRNASRQYLKRYDEIAKILTNDRDARAKDGSNWVNELCKSLQIPNLSKFGFTEDLFPELVKRSIAASSMKGNPVRLTDEEFTQILQKSICLNR
jgi:alcohol dehydrogenase class IV